MSTNIQIDVVLQRLKRQADQATQQNRERKAEREELQQTERQARVVKGQRESGDSQKRVSPLAGPSDSSSDQPSAEQLKKRSADRFSSVPDLYQRKRPAAQVSQLLNISNAWIAEDYSIKSESTGVSRIAGRTTSQTLTVTTGQATRYYVGSGDGKKWFAIDISYSFTLGQDDWQGDQTINITNNGEIVNTLIGGNRTVSANATGAYGYNPLILPAGGDKFILILVFTLAAYRSFVNGVYTNDPGNIQDLKSQFGNLQSADFVQDVRTELYGFLCSRDDIKAVAVPSALRGYIQDLIVDGEPDDLVIAKRENNAAEGAFVLQVPTRGVFPFLQYSSFGYDGFSTYSGTPAVYYALNNLVRYTSPEKLIDPLVWSQKRGKAVRENSDAGGFALLLDQSAIDVYSSSAEIEFLYSLYRGPASDFLPGSDGVNNDQFRELPSRYSFVLPADRLPLPQPIDAELFDQLESLDLIGTSDWGEATYCQRQLKALGFSSSDLKFD